MCIRDSCPCRRPPDLRLCSPFPSQVCIYRDLCRLWAHGEDPGRCAAVEPPQIREHCGRTGQGLRLGCPSPRVCRTTGISPPIVGVSVSYTHLRAHETKANLVCRLLLEKKKTQKIIQTHA